MKTTSFSCRAAVAFLPALITILSIASAHASAVLTSYSYSWSKELEHTYIEYYDCVGTQVTVESMQSLNYSWNLLGGASSAGQYQSTTTIEGVTCPTIEQNSSATEWQAWQGQGIAVVAGSKETCDPNDEPVERYEHTNTVGAFNQYLRWEWRNTTEETASETIITSGSPTVGIAPVSTNISRQSLWWIGVSATDLLTGQPIPPGQITIAGKTPDAQGSVFVKLNDGQWNDVTPGFGTLTGGDHHILVSMGAVRMPMSIVMDVTYTFWEDDGDGGGYEYDLDLPTVVNDWTQTNWVGQRVMATMEMDGVSDLENAGYTVTTSHAWTVAQYPKTFGNYNENAQSQQLTPAFALTSPGISFCWLDKSPSETLAAAMTVNIGTNAFTLNAETKFTVKRPEGTLTAIVEPPYIWENEKIRTPCGLAAGFPSHTGSWMICQLVASAQAILVANGNPPPCYVKTYAPGLDGESPNYGTIASGAMTGLFDTDFSSEVFEPFSLALSCGRTYNTYLMFKPNGSGANWVPIKQLSWNWQASAAQDSSGWELEQWIPTGITTHTGTDTTTHPQWSATASYSNFSISQCP